MKKQIIEKFADSPSAIGRETCEFKFALTESNPEEGTFTGTASVFGSIVNTWYPTIILPGAFTKTIKESGARVKLLHQHDVCEPIGKPTRLEESQIGLELDGKISQTTRGKDDLILMRDGVIEEMSIGFDPIEGKVEHLPLSKCIEQQLVKNPSQWKDMDEKEMIRVIREVRLWEVSLVTWGADPMTGIMAVHSLQQCESTLGFSLDEFSEAIQEVHAGKVLSAKNKKLLSDAVSALQALIDAAEPPDSDDDKQALTVNTEQLSQLARMKTYFAQYPINQSQ